MPENLDGLKIKKCNVKIWSEIQPHTRSKDLQTQKMHGYVLKAIGAISGIANIDAWSKSEPRTNSQQYYEGIHEGTPNAYMYWLSSYFA